MKLVVITGCLGLIGMHVTKHCLDKGWKVLGIDKITYASNPNVLAQFSYYENFDFRKEDICEIKQLPDCDYVIKQSIFCIKSCCRYVSSCVGKNLWN